MQHRAAPVGYALIILTALLDNGAYFTVSDEDKTIEFAQRNRDNAGEAFFTQIRHQRLPPHTTGCQNLLDNCSARNKHDRRQCAEGRRQKSNFFELHSAYCLLPTVFLLAT